MSNHDPRPHVWSDSEQEWLARLATGSQGLASDDATQRLARYGANTVRPGVTRGTIELLLAQFCTPVVILLIATALLSVVLHDAQDAGIILIIVVASGLLGFLQERGATDMVAQLVARLRVRARVLRDSVEREITADEVVPGDIVLLSAGAMIPGDCRLLESRDLYVDEAALTGESFPAAKGPGVLAPDTALARCTNSLFMGTSVVSGTGKALVIATGAQTYYGELSRKMTGRPPETDFERGVRHFGYFLMEVTLVLVVVIFAINVYFERPVIDSLMFSMALAVGLTPQLLPAVVTLNMSHGARRMAELHVIVKRLSSIQNLGTMDVLCTDKTGTLTEGRMRVGEVIGADGAPSDRVRMLAYLNASHESGFSNPIDEAIRRDCGGVATDGWSKVDEIPYDFSRKRLSVLLARGDERLLITKGAVEPLLPCCGSVEGEGGTSRPIDGELANIRASFERLSAAGHRSLGVAYRSFEAGRALSRVDEQGMTLAGLISFADPPRADAARVIEELQKLGVVLKIITGDNRLVAETVARSVGLRNQRVVTGRDIASAKAEALPNMVEASDVFAEIEPNQKAAIIAALKKHGHSVGYMGDGINDGAALHVADVGISVDGALDVAKDAADMVLLEKDLGVLADGVREGRRTFANTQKYVFMATSANFGNMFSMAAGSLFLSFLPLLPKQILLVNLLTDLPEMAIANDDVDPELLERPRHWDITFIRRFMITFGPLSSIFDLLTFAVLLLGLRAGVAEFRTGWFVESVVSASAIVLSVRTRRSAFRSRPGEMLALATVVISIAAAALPFTPVARLLGFVPLPSSYILTVAVIVFVYAAAAEQMKRFFYARLAG